MDHDLMKKCDEFLSARVLKRGMPHDFDDVTYVMHDFVQWLAKHPPSEQQREHEERKPGGD